MWSKRDKKKTLKEKHNLIHLLLPDSLFKLEPLYGYPKTSFLSHLFCKYSIFLSRCSFYGFKSLRDVTISIGRLFACARELGRYLG